MLTMPSTSHSVSLRHFESSFAQPPFSSVIFALLQLPLHYLSLLSLQPEKKCLKMKAKLQNDYLNLNYIFHCFHSGVN